jgi:hypothetical protein
MATITILKPETGVTKTITLTMEASIIAQDMDGGVDFFATLSTTARDVSNQAIAKQTILSLSDGAGGPGLDRKGNALPDSGKYNNFTEAVNDYVAMMVEGNKDEPWTEMNFA